MSFLAGAEPKVIAALDQRFAVVNAAIDNVIGGRVGECQTLVETYAGLIVSVPDDMGREVAVDWLCVALSRLAHANKPVSSFEEEI